jgi:hypothetical protein
LNSALPSDTVYTIAIDSDGTKWIGTAKGLAAFNENGLKTSVRHDQKFLDETVLYPNPAHDFITLKIQKQLQNPIVDIININGQLIHSCRIQNNQNRLDISALSSGVYMVRIQSDENHFIKKFVKQ